MKKMKYLLLIFLLIKSTQEVSAWGLTGHRTIAQIAENHLTKKARKNIDKIIGNQHLAYWSNWADFIKSDPNPARKEESSWHFINTAGNLTYEDFVSSLGQSSENNLYKAYMKLKRDAKAGNLSLVEKQEHLYYLIHLLADAHQPMHVSRQEDLGGNRIDVTWFGRKTNIHRVWDSDLIDGEQYAYTEYAAVLDIYDKNFYTQYTSSSLEEWLYESHQLANEIYDDVAQQKNLSYQYGYKFKYKMESALLKAGIRLAKELNEIYG